MTPSRPAQVWYPWMLHQSILGAPTVLSLLSEGEGETLRNFEKRMLRSLQEVARINESPDFTSTLA